MSSQTLTRTPYFYPKSVHVPRNGDFPEHASRRSGAASLLNTKLEGKSANVRSVPAAVLPPKKRMAAAAAYKISPDLS